MAEEYAEHNAEEKSLRTKFQEASIYTYMNNNISIYDVNPQYPKSSVEAMLVEKFVSNYMYWLMNRAQVELAGRTFEEKEAQFPSLLLADNPAHRATLARAIRIQLDYVANLVSLDNIYQYLKTIDEYLGPNSTMDYHPNQTVIIAEGYRLLQQGIPYHNEAGDQLHLPSLYDLVPREQTFFIVTTGLMPHPLKEISNE